MYGPHSMDQILISKLTDIVLANIHNERFDVETLARGAGVSRTTIHRKLKSIKNQNVSQFIREIRLNRAKELLLQNVGTVSEIAYMVGFGSPAYFNKCFHDFFGYPPGKIKKEGPDISNEAGMGRREARSSSGRERKKVYIILSASLLLPVIFAIAVIILNNYRLEKRYGLSIAVLPFTNLSPVDTNKYFIDGLMEDILGDLSKIKDLTVLSKTSTEQFRNSGKSPSEIADILNVRYLVEGSGQKTGNVLVLRVGLIEMPGEKELWAESYTRQILHSTDIDSLQNEIAGSISAELKAIITPEERQLIDKRSTYDLNAIDFYQRAREELGKLPFYDMLAASTTCPVFLNSPVNKALISKARTLYNTSLEFDSTFAPAYVDLAAIYWSRNFFRNYFSVNYLDSVLILANRALSFDDRLADAYYMRAMYYGETGNIKQARKDFERTLELDPNHWLAYYGKGSLYLEEFADADYTIALDNFLNAEMRYHGSALPFLLQRIAYTLDITGFSAVGFEYSLKASKLEADSAKHYFSLYGLEIWRGNPGAALRYLEKAYLKDSDNISIVWHLARFLGSKGDSGRSLKCYRRYLFLLKKNGITMVNDLHRVAEAYEAAGMTDSADYYNEKQLEKCNKAILLGRPYGISFAYYDLAIIYGSKGDRAKALENLKIFRNRKGMCAWFLPEGEKGLKKFRDDPEFRKIFDGINEDYNSEHERVKKWLVQNNLLAD